MKATGGNKAQSSPLAEALKLSRSEKIRSVLAEGPTTWWTSGIYSLGMAFRSLLKIPRWIPLDFMSDHGVTFARNDYVLELMRNAEHPPVYLSWFEGQVNRAHAVHGGDPVVDVYGCPHPWTAVMNNFSFVQHGSDGCLGFVPHSVLGGVPNISFMRSLVDSWNELPNSLRPTALCVSSHELIPEVLEELERYNLPLFTVGNPNSGMFLERFVRLRCEFKYSTSPILGSVAFYSTELGLKHFLHGEWNTEVTPALGVDDWRETFRAIAQEDPEIDLDLWGEADSVFRETALSVSPRVQLSDYLLGKHFYGNLAVVRERLVDVDFSAVRMSWKRVVARARVAR